MSHGSDLRIRVAGIGGCCLISLLLASAGCGGGPSKPLPPLKPGVARLVAQTPGGANRETG